MEDLKNAFIDVQENLQEMSDDAKTFMKGDITRAQFRNRVAAFSAFKAEFQQFNRDMTKQIRGDADKLRSHSESVKIIRASVRAIEDALGCASDQDKLVAPAPLHAVNLPKFELPTFSGDLAHWKQFSDQFKGAMAQDCLLPAIKFRYLLSVLRGEPLTLVRHLEVTDAHFPVAWKILEDRYDNMRCLLEHHVNAILTAPAITGITSLDKITRFHDLIVEHKQALEALGHKPQEFIWVVLVIRKLDETTRLAWERTTQRDKLPTLDDLLAFLGREIAARQTIRFTSSEKTTSHVPYRHPPSNYAPRNPKAHNFATSATTITCSLCNGNHFIYHCNRFKVLTVAQRKSLTAERSLCLNCLSPSHNLSACKSKMSCSHCNKRHHSLLHEQPMMTTPQPTGSQPATSATAGQSHSGSYTAITTLPNMNHMNNFALLGTALIDIRAHDGIMHTVRAVLDSASQNTYITESCVQRLMLRKQRSNISISTLGRTPFTAVKGAVQCSIYPHSKNSPSYATTAIVIPRISGSMPSVQLETQILKDWSHLQLADPDFITPSKIDVLLGADIFPYVLTGQRQTLKANALAALETTLGWVLTGHIQHPPATDGYTFFLQEDELLEKSVSRFWEIEEVQEKVTNFSPEDCKCEKLFAESHTRAPCGRYVVNLPFRENLPDLGDSRTTAIQCFLSLERRLASNDTLRQDYNTFMRDYLDANHMKLINRQQSIVNRNYYIPHHCILKPESSTTKLRVVFNASKRTNLNQSLNDALLTGPPLQTDLTAVLLRFRFHRYVLTADIRQMYRQILVHPNHRSYQRIIWRFTQSEPLQDYELQTVTYGVSSAPYLAIRTLQQLSSDEKLRYPLASSTLLRDAYVDDIISGSNSLSEAQQMTKELVLLLAAGGFELRKWASNVREVLSDVPPEHHQFDVKSLDLDPEPVMKILGLYWTPKEDTFSYRINPLDRSCTKRVILSDIARIFDPLGLMAPVIMYAKILLQQLWTLTVGWDERPSDEIVESWMQFQNQLPLLANVRVARHIPSEEPLKIIGFCDASNLGYAAVVYVRSAVNELSLPQLLCAKSRVAPLKRLSIPRLELCAALLLARLMKTVRKTLSIDIESVLAFSDSTITLSWISSPPHLLKVFESNRVTEIQESIPPSHWRHVSSHDNPADCASRGLLPSELGRHDLWWTGPSWLATAPAAWAITRPLATEPRHGIDDETAITLMTPVAEPSFIEKFSSFSKLRRVTAYILRFVDRCRHKESTDSTTLTTIELQRALIWLVKITQNSEFSAEKEKILKKQLCVRQIQKLNPFLDSDGLIRVGGRLRYSNLPYHEKHPLLLPQRHHLTSLIIEHYHKTNLHVGPGTLMSILSRSYWVLSARRAIQRCINRCLTCFRANPKPYTPKMGDLPKFRVQQLRPFQSVGTDFGGPFKVTQTRTRGACTTKAYLCLFICLSTKAIHLELTSELSTQAFLAAFRRFIARRGKCSDIYSDCGTNYVGASRYLDELQIFLNSKENQSSITIATSTELIRWHFNPPSAPHFGGIWEAGIKSVKRHISRVIGEQILTFEEFYTVLTQIEAVLNSRPLSPISNDPNDLRVLTPGHFLIGEPLVLLPEPDLAHLPCNRLSRWQLLQQLQQTFWRRWRNEYLHTLQQRAKWLSDPPSPIAGTLVVIKDNLSAPSHWQLGRILHLISGKDGISRVAKVKTQNGELLRPLVKLCPLPLQF